MAKICMLLNNEFRWDRRVQREATTLIEAGHDVTLICSRDRQGTLKHVEEKDGIPVHRVFPKRFNTFNPFSLKRHGSAFLKIITGFGRFDVVHAHDINTLLLGDALRRWWRAKLVYDSHELWSGIVDERLNQSSHPREKKQLQQLKAMEQRLIPKADGLITINQSVADALQAFAPSVKTDWVISRNMPDPVTVPHEKPRYFHQYFHLAPDTRIILYQGGIAATRGVNVAMDAMEQLVQRAGYENTALVFMGPMMSEGFEKNFHQRVTGHTHIFYKETVLGPELPLWTASADIGLAPIQPVQENYRLCLPNKVFEFIQAELPIVASDLPEIRRVIDDYDVGQCFVPDDVKQLTQTMDDVLDNKASYSNALRHAKAKLHWDNEKHQLLSLYNKMCKPLS